ncbi:ATP-binding cassette domain-containing protein [Bacillus cereus]
MKKKAEKLLEKVGLLDKKDTYPNRLSGGQKATCSNCKSVSNGTEVMLFDEPTSALDQRW